MVDALDIADAATAELLLREHDPHPLPRTTIEFVGPNILQGIDVAAIWSSVLNSEIPCGGDDLAAFEEQTAKMMPGWQVRDLRTMLRAFNRYGKILARTPAHARRT